MMKRKFTQSKHAAAQSTLAAAFHEVTLAIAGLLELHNANPALTQATTATLKRVYRSHLARTKQDAKASTAFTALYELAREMAEVGSKK